MLLGGGDEEVADRGEEVLPAAGPARLPTPAAADKVFERTHGVLRLINNLATAALLAAAAAGKKHVDAREVEDAVFDQEST